MKRPIIFAIALTAGVLALSAHAQTYLWKDANGHTVISDTPPPGTAKNIQSRGVPAAATAPAPAAPPPSAGAVPAETAKAPPAAKNMAEKEVEFQKRQQEAKDKADKDAKNQQAMAEKRENCERARRNIAALESNQPMGQLDENGQRKVMDTAQRDQELERARQVVSESCK